uniref:COesterase domain-containing protein n=1 Tax=Elaeophora elaphi TaxID=1147741 RepID=A0A0R3RTA7_9BILA
MVKIFRCNTGIRTVTTTFGVLRGEMVSPNVGDLPPVAQYLGVPYGVAPSGQYRFNMAISAAKWTHMPKDAYSLSSVCIQSGIPELAETKALKTTSAQRYDHMHKLLPKLKPQSEDCLHMNLYVPEKICTFPSESQRENSDLINSIFTAFHADSNRRQLPVLVVVHGDEYGWNSGNPYNGTILASYGQIIVITLNYRLGVFGIVIFHFGFLGRCESSSCSGNSGLSDLVAALKMLTNILPAFGGDPSLITLLGWGSGASLVSLLMASPITQPNNRMFRRAILLDGSALAPWAMSKNPQPIFFQLAEHLKCIEKVDKRKRLSYDQRSTESIVRCMQDHSPQNITRAARKISTPTFLSRFAPIVDGQVVPNKPEALFGTQYGSLFRSVDLLVGMTSNPAHYLLPNEDILLGIDKEKRERIFRTLIRNLYDFHRKEILAALINEYTDWDNPKDHPKTIRNGVLAALSDVLFVAPLIETARLHSIDDDRETSNTFMFLFAHESKSTAEETIASGIRGSISGDHIPYIFGYPLSKDDDLYSGFTNEDQMISRVMMHYISNFVKSGDPTKPVQLQALTPIAERFHSAAWPQLTQRNREPYLEITDRPRVKNYYRNAQVGFWNGLIPQLHANGKEGVPVPEEHHFLPNHFKRESFFGTVRPYASYANEPFPPPPLPPTPLPKSIEKLTTFPSRETNSDGTPTTPMPFVKAAQNSTMLSVTVAVGCGLLFLNICIGLGLYRQCNKKEETKKKLQLQYQTYSANYPLNATDMKYINNVAGQQQLNYMSPPPPPSLSQRPSITNSMTAPLDSTSSKTNEFEACRTSSYQNYNDTSHNDALITKCNFQEQEPLLSTTSKTSVGSLRIGVSPTCPKHGRAAMAQANSKVNSLSGLSTGGHTLEEIQV